MPLSMIVVARNVVVVVGEVDNGLFEVFRRHGAGIGHKAF